MVTKNCNNKKDLADYKNSYKVCDKFNLVTVTLSKYKFFIKSLGYISEITNIPQISGPLWLNGYIVLS